MSKLREKFIPHCDNVVMDKEVNSEFCEQITDDFAVSFAEWCLDIFLGENSFLYLDKQTTELLQIFKDKYYDR